MMFNLTKNEWLVCAKGYILVRLVCRVSNKDNPLRPAEPCVLLALIIHITYLVPDIPPGHKLFMSLLSNTTIILKMVRMMPIPMINRIALPRPPALTALLNRLPAPVPPQNLGDPLLVLNNLNRQPGRGMEGDMTM